MTVAEQLRTGAAALRLDLPAAAKEKLLAFAALLAKWNAVYNLTAIREPERMLTHHLLDCLAVLPMLPQAPVLRVLDVGSGGGLPGIPFAIVRPAWQLTLLDSNHKKTTFLRQTAIELDLQNVVVATERVEAFIDPLGFDLVITRAFADLAEFVHLAGRLAKPGGLLVAMKGVYPHEELAALPKDWKHASVERLDVPGLAADRHLVKLLKAA